MQEEEVEEVLKMMTEKMLAMNQRIEVLNEKQNKIGDQELQTDVSIEDGTQILIPGL